MGGWVGRVFSFPSLGTFSGKCQKPAGPGMSGLKELLHRSRLQSHRPFHQLPCSSLQEQKPQAIVPLSQPASPPPLRIVGCEKQQRERSGSTCGEIPAPSGRPPTPGPRPTPPLHWKFTPSTPAEASFEREQDLSGLDCPAMLGPEEPRWGSGGHSFRAVRGDTGPLHRLQMG